MLAADLTMGLRYILEISLDVSDTLAGKGGAYANRDPRLVTISSVSVTNSRRRTLLNVTPNSFPATRVSAGRDLGDNNIVEFVQV